MIIIKRSKIVVDAFTCRKVPYEYFPIDHANKFIPDWWKQTPKFTSETKSGGNGVTFVGNTIRRCAGVIDYYNKNGLVIPMWSDLKVEYGPQEFKYLFADNKSKLINHSTEMRGKFMPEYEHFKLASPWKLKEKSGIKFHFSQLFYNFEDPGKLVLPPAIVNYKYQNSTEINFMVKRPAAINTLIIKAGQPLVLLTPLTEKEVVIKHHLIDEAKFNQEFDWIFAFHNLYNKSKRILEGKCPFHG